jgi:hypothetical protein
VLEREVDIWWVRERDEREVATVDDVHEHTELRVLRDEVLGPAVVPHAEHRLEQVQHDAVVRCDDRELVRVDRRERVDHLAFGVCERAADRNGRSRDDVLEDRGERRVHRSSSLGMFSSKSLTDTDGDTCFAHVPK